MIQSSETSRESEFQGRTILIVDDNVTNLGVMAEYLEGYGFTILVARDGESTLEKARYGRPDLILLDVMMPGIDGFETCRRLKADEITREIPVIFLTALAIAEEKVKGFKIGAVDYVTKPLNQEEVLARVTTHLRLRTLTQKLQQELAERKRAEAELIASENRFRQVVSSISDHIYVTEITEDGRRVNLYLSPHVEPLTGYPLEKFVTNWNFWPSTVIHPDDRAIAAAQAAKLASGQSSQMEYRLVRANGEIIWVRDSGRVEKDVERNSLITYGLVSNITRRKWVEDALWQSEERTRMIIDTALDAVITMDTKGVITDWNAQAAAIFGWSRQEAVGQSLSTIIIPFQHREAYQRGLKHFLATGESPILNRHIEINALHRDGHEFPVELSISPLHLGDIVIFTAFVRDITERKRAEAELAQAHEQVLEASRFKSELLANVSHDLRTPLTAIMGYSDMLQAGVFGLLSDKQQAVATRIRINTEQLLLFINNLLDQAQIESGKLELRVSSFVPFGLIEAIESTMSILAQAKGLELSSDIAPEVPAILSGDFQRLKAILMNLVSNAIKFTNQGSVQIRIYQPDTDHWALQVSDTGRGIPPTAQTYIFDAFRQVDGAVTRQKAGSGLGLSIVKRLTNAMGGQISLVSEPDQGSTFTILLPLIPVEESGA